MLQVRPHPRRPARIVVSRVVEISSSIVAPIRRFQETDVLDGAVALDEWDFASTGDATARRGLHRPVAADALPDLGAPPVPRPPFPILLPFRMSGAHGPPELRAL